jgi:hypothetical protein
MMLENKNQGGALHMEREATGAIAVQLKKKSEINTFLSSFNTGIVGTLVRLSSLNLASLLA